MIYTLLCLASFTRHDYFEILLCVSVAHFFLLLRNIPLYGYTILRLSLHPTGHCQSVDIKNKAAMDIHVQVFGWTYAFIPHDKSLRVEWLDIMTGTCLNF